MLQTQSQISGTHISIADFWLKQLPCAFWDSEKSNQILLWRFQRVWSYSKVRREKVITPQAFPGKTFHFSSDCWWDRWGFSEGAGLWIRLGRSQVHKLLTLNRTKSSSRTIGSKILNHSSKIYCSLSKLLASIFTCGFPIKPQAKSNVLGKRCFNSFQGYFVIKVSNNRKITRWTCCICCISETILCLNFLSYWYIIHFNESVKLC